MVRNFAEMKNISCTERSERAVNSARDFGSKVAPNSDLRPLHELVSAGSDKGWRVLDIGGQATKGVRWMPRQREAMKDAVSCDKLR